MKKWIALILALTMLFALAACGGDTNANVTPPESGNSTSSGNGNPSAGGSGNAAATVAPVAEDKQLKELVQASTWGIRTWCMFNNSNKPSIYINFVDPLVTVDANNISRPALAERWEANADDTVWTFHLREGVTWVDYEGNYKGDVTSEDWLWGLEWTLNFWKNDSYNTTIPMSVIKGAREYYEYTQNLPEEEAWELGVDKLQEMVGIETPDPYTITYTCINPCAYFDSLATSVFLYPLAKGQLDEVGTKGYKSIGPFDLWCNGPYVIETYLQDNSWSIVPNPSYWDDSVSVFDRVTVIKVESGDRAWELLQLGEVDWPMSLGTSITNLVWNDPTNEWHDYLAKQPDTGVSWGIFFNYAKNTLNDTPDTNWNTAVANENFRQCFYYGLDLYNYFATIDPIDPASVARGTMTVYGLASLSDGTDYTELVYDAINYDPYSNYSHQDLDKLADYKAKAMEELTAQGVSFPVHVDLWAGSSQGSVDTYTILKEILEDYLGKDFVEVEIHSYITNKTSEVYKPGYLSVEIQGYGALFSDPLTFLNQMCSDMAGNAEWSNLYGHIENCANEEAVALFDEFTAMVRAADEIVGDHDARYKALAEAEAFAIKHVLMIPTHTPASREVTPINAYSKPAVINDSQSGRYVNWETNTDYYTMQDVALIKEAYYANRGGN